MRGIKKFSWDTSTGGDKNGKRANADAEKAGAGFHGLGIRNGGRGDVCGRSALVLFGGRKEVLMFWD